MFKRQKCFNNEPYIKHICSPDSKRISIAIFSNTIYDILDSSLFCPLPPFFGFLIVPEIEQFKDPTVRAHFIPRWLVLLEGKSK